MSKEAQPVAINTGFIRLDAFLKFAAVLPTGGAAKMVVQEGSVLVNGAVCTQRGKKLYPGDLVQMQGDKVAYKVVSD